MTKKQFKYIAAKVRKDCAITAQYFSEDRSKTCFIGSLIPVKFRKLVIEEYNSKGLGALPADILSHLYKTTGLNYDQLLQLQGINDCASTVRQRRLSIMDELRTMGVE